ncbi:hypothetical protein VU12_08835 [Desulfobulbus sp. US4]|nr:hypothetical protein [Desulfobulbus sp. US4]
MKNSWRPLLVNGLVVLASFFVSPMIISISHYYSLGFFFIIIAPLIGSFLAAYMVLFFLEDRGGLYLIQTFWQTLLLGATVAFVVTAGCVCSISQHFLFFFTISM